MIFVGYPQIVRIASPPQIIKCLMSSFTTLTNNTQKFVGVLGIDMFCIFLFLQQLLSTRKDILLYPFLQKAVLSWILSRIGVVFQILIITIYKCVLCSEEGVCMGLIIFRNSEELHFLHIFIIITEAIRYLEFSFAILSRIRELINAHILAHDLAEMESRIYHDLAVSMHLLRIHSPHRGTNDDVRILIMT